MKNRLYQSLFLGITSAIAASASYALITPQNIQTQSKLENLNDNSKFYIKKNLARTVKHKIKSGESLSSIFPKYDIDSITLDKITTANKNISLNFADLSVDKILSIKINQQGELENLIYRKDLAQTLVATRQGDEFYINIESKPIESIESMAQGYIENNLSTDGSKAGLSYTLINQLADKIFAWDIDFTKDLHAGDKFTVIYEQGLIEGKRYNTGDILAAELVIDGKSYSAVRYKDATGKIEYYSPQEKKIRKIRKTFLRSPIEFARISSHFNLKRKHPILNRIRAHKGVDYAAKTGTPIKTIGNGTIAFRGVQRGYGNVIIVKHGKKYSSLYAHMSKFNKKYALGSEVNQGNIIGYVGKSGLATGAHLHYEFLVNGVHKNPLTVNLPRTEPAIDKVFIANFQQQTQKYVNQLNSASTETAKINLDSLQPQTKH